MSEIESPALAESKTISNRGLTKLLQQQDKESTYLEDIHRSEGKILTGRQEEVLETFEAKTNLTQNFREEVQLV